MSFTYRANLDRPLSSGELDGNLQLVETLHDAIQLKADRLYDDVPAGLTATSDGEYFAAISSEPGEAFRIYRNDAGAETFIAMYSDIPIGERALHTADIPANHASETETHGAPAEERLVHTGDEARLPFPQILGDSGRFDGGEGGLVRETSGPWAMPSSFFNGTNGATFSEAGKFINDNDNFGGSSGTMTQTTEDLINAMGRTGGDAQFGVEFFITEILAGTGTAADKSFNGTTRYRMFGSRNVAIFSAGGWSTFACWVRAVGSPLGLLQSDGLYINGDPQGDYELDPAQGWVHWRVIARSDRGYISAFPYPYSNDGGGCQIAVPAIFGGQVNTGIHTAPLIASGVVDL